MSRTALPVLGFVLRATLVSAGVCASLCNGAYADSGAQADDLPSTCTELIQEKSVIRAGEPSLFKILAKLVFDRGSFVSPDVIPDVSAGASPSQESQDSGPGGPAEEIRIFTLGHVEPVTDSDRALLKAVRAEEKHQLKAINRILKTRTADECVAEARKIGWSPDQLDGLQKLEDRALQATRHEESQLSMKMAEKAAKNHSSWTVVPVDSWGEILQSLRSTPASGMMLIAHADSNGRLYDSLRDELPTGFFKALPAPVRFIGVFSCESAQVAQAYSLDQLAGREVVTVKLSAPFNAAATTPIQFFPNWVKNLEKEKLIDLTGLAGPAEAECPITLDGLTLKQGRLAVTIRGLAAGVWSGENETEPQLVPCSWLADPSTLSVFAEPSQLGESVIFDSPVFSARFQSTLSGSTLSGPTLSLTDEQIYKTDSGDFRSAILSNP